MAAMCEEKEYRNTSHKMSLSFTIRSHNWLVVSTPLKNIGQNGNLPQVGVKIKNILNHHLDNKTKPCSTSPVRFNHVFPVGHRS